MNFAFENLETNTNTKIDSHRDFMIDENQNVSQRINSNENEFSSNSAKLRLILNNSKNNFINCYDHSVFDQKIKNKNENKDENNYNSTLSNNHLKSNSNYTKKNDISSLNQTNFIKFNDFQFYPIKSGMSQIDIDLKVNEFQNRIKTLKQDNEYLEKEIYDKNLKISELERNITIIKQENKSLNDSLKIDELKSKIFSLEKTNLILNEQLRIYEFSNKTNNDFCFNYNLEEAKNKLLMENKTLNLFLSKFYSFYNRLITYIDNFKEKFKYDMISKTILDKKLSEQESIIHDYFLSDMNLKLSFDKRKEENLFAQKNSEDDFKYNCYDLEKQLSILENLIIGLLDDKTFKTKNFHNKNESLFSYNSNFSNDTFNTKKLIDDMINISNTCNKDTDYVKNEKDVILQNIKNEPNEINYNCNHLRSNEKNDSKTNDDSIFQLNEKNNKTMSSQIKDMSIKDNIKFKISETKKFLEEKCNDDKYKKSFYLDNSVDKQLANAKDVKKYIKADIYLGNN